MINKYHNIIKNNKDCQNHVFENIVNENVLNENVLNENKHENKHENVMNENGNENINENINESEKSKYLENILDDYTEEPLFCDICNKEYKHHSSFYRHRKKCTSLKQKIYEPKKVKYNSINDLTIKENEKTIEQLKKEYQYQLEIEKLKNEINKKELEKKMEITEMENKHLQLFKNGNQIINNNMVNNNTIINNNLKISKIQYLNLNFGNVIDINTFIENYKNKYGLTNSQALTLLENYQNDGINGCISTLVYYLKQSAIKQYKELKGKEIPIEDVILPFVLSDKSLREHFEKSINGKWDKTTMVENIKKIVMITNNQVYNHHNKFLNFNAAQRKRIINGVLKASGYSVLSQISNPDFYKIDSDSNSNYNNTINDISQNNNESQNSHIQIQSQLNNVDEEYDTEDDIEDEEEYENNGEEIDEDEEQDEEQGDE